MRNIATIGGSFNKETQDFLNFVRCQRPDGSFYGTAGKCKKGVEVSAKVMNTLQEKAKAGNKKARLALEVIEGEKTKEEARKELQASAPNKEADPKEHYSALVKKQQELVSQGKLDEAAKMSKDVADALVKYEASSQGKTASQEIEDKLKTAEQKDKEKRRWLDESTRKQKSAPLSAEDREAILTYTKETDGPGSYEVLNTCLRRPKECTSTKESKEAYKKLKAAIEKLPKNENGVEFYRGMNLEGRTDLYDKIEKLKPGDKISDKGFGSYSAQKRIASSFLYGSNRGVVLISRSNSMTPIHSFSRYTEEEEGLLPPGTKQTVTKVYKGENGTLYVELE